MLLIEFVENSCLAWYLVHGRLSRIVEELVLEELARRHVICVKVRSTFIMEEDGE